MAQVLVVDDSAFTRKMMRKMLESLGHNVIEAENGPLALQQYAKQRVDIVTLDLLMPDMEGPEVLDHLKSIDPQVCVIVCTSNVQVSAENEMLNKGTVAFLNKPVKDHMLEEAIAKAMGRHQNATNA